MCGPSIIGVIVMMSITKSKTGIFVKMEVNAKKYLLSSMFHYQAIFTFSLLDNFGINGGRNGFLYVQGVTKLLTRLTGFWGTLRWINIIMEMLYWKFTNTTQLREFSGA